MVATVMTGFYSDFRECTWAGRVSARWFGGRSLTASTVR